MGKTDDRKLVVDQGQSWRCRLDGRRQSTVPTQALLNGQALNRKT
jgi:hypothetical protein